MAEIVKEVLQDLAKNETLKESTTSGTLIAMTNLMVMSLISIVIGAFRSLPCLRKKKETGRIPETFTLNDTEDLPILACYYLAVFYIISSLFSKEYIQLLLKVLTFSSGVLSLPNLLRSVLSKVVPVGSHPFSLVYVEGAEVIFSLSFGKSDILTYMISFIIGGIYFWNEHWLLNNLFGIAFIIHSVEFTFLNDILYASFMIIELIIFDFYWVWQTNMAAAFNPFTMSTYLVFPSDFIGEWPNYTGFFKLAVSDIAIPGMYLAVLLRFDYSLGLGTITYFYSSLLAYFLGLTLAFIFSITYRCSACVLFFCVPLCVATAATMAIRKKDVPTIIKYFDLRPRPRVI